MRVMKAIKLILVSLLFSLHDLSVSSLPIIPKIPSREVKESSSSSNNNGALAAAAGFQAELMRRAPRLVIAGFLSFALDPLVEQVFNATQLTWNKGAYKTTLLYGAADSIEHAGKAYGVCLIVDWVMTLIPKLKEISPINVDLGEAAPHIGLTIWAARTLSRIKSMLLRKAVYGKRVGKVGLIDRLLDFGIGVTTIYNILYRLKVNFGMGLQSLFAASGASAIIISLAGKGIVEQIIGGLMLQAWDAIEEGEYVKLGDGTEGTVVSIGLLETELLGHDCVPVRVPNSQIVGKRVSLYSKVTKSQVKQTLRFKYSDLDKIPEIIQSIKDEIETRCNTEYLAKPPSVALNQYEADHIQVAVSVQFDLPPGSEFSKMRELVLFSIADAIKRNGVDFAIPAIQYETKSSDGKTILQANTVAS